MSDWTITPESVRAPTGAPREVFLAAQNIGPGNYVWAPNTNYVDLANAANVNAAVVKGMTVDFAYTGQPITVVSAGLATTGNAAAANGQGIYLSTNAGLACNFADIPAGNYITRLGWANNATTAQLAIEVTGRIV